uniref:Uncharacterized protein n=1 Tax=Panagrolaimus sp. ES5 TaxID=591445 RepID=A0AC34G522_9BILA
GLCFDNFEYGRIFCETFKSSTPTSSDECSVDRIEIYPCYTKNDPMNIFWGVNNTEFDFICNGSTAVATASHSLFSFNPPVQKYALIDKEMQEVLLNGIVSSTAFFFQCPECALESRIHPSSNFFKLKKDNQKKLRYTIGMINESIPFNARTCVGSLSTNCDLDESRFIENTGNSFSQRILNFTIVEDKEFCSV